MIRCLIPFLCLVGCASLERGDGGQGSGSNPPVDAPNVSVVDAYVPPVTPDAPKEPDGGSGSGCQPECTCDSDCPDGGVCRDGTCHETCNCDYDCGNHYECHSHVCYNPHGD